MTRPYALRNDQWERIKDLLPGQEGKVGVTAKENRLFVEAVLYTLPGRNPQQRLAGAMGRFGSDSHSMQALGQKQVYGSGYLGTWRMRVTRKTP
ncbi:MAG: hypothetical protein BRC45_01260 [Cyanobacteria bacterium QS_5_48_63]|nr:MAG: hypothetical protein BRC45_01260 [Cyanobacteria bacterium QS_5_48_63]